MKRVAIIPARGGSKRIKRKNIRSLAGKPVITYPIAAALESGLFSEVMVSTDDQEIAEVSKRAGASVPFMRAAATAGDHATIADVLSEVIDQYKNKGLAFDEVCCLLPTAALISATRIQEAHEIFVTGGFSSLVPVLRFSYPIQRALSTAGGVLSLREPQHINTRSQDLEPHFHDAAQFYWLRTSEFLKERRVFTSKAGFIELDEREAQDVDTEQDWEMLELKFQPRIKKTI